MPVVATYYVVSNASNASSISYISVSVQYMVFAPARKRRRAELLFASHRESWWLNRSPVEVLGPHDRVVVVRGRKRIDVAVAFEVDPTYRARQCAKRLRGSSVNQTPPPPLVHEPRPRGSRRCTELELSVGVVHESSCNSSSAWSWFTKVHETRSRNVPWFMEPRRRPCASACPGDIAPPHWPHYFLRFNTENRETNRHSTAIGVSTEPT